MIIREMVTKLLIRVFVLRKTNSKGEIIDILIVYNRKYNSCSFTPYCFYLFDGFNKALKS